MKRLALIAAAAVITASAGAREWSLDDCIAYAIDHNIEVRQRMVSQQQGELSVTEAKDQFLPQLNGYGSQSFNFGRGLTADNTYANRNTSSFSVGASLSLPIFQGLRAVRNLKYSQTNLRALVERTEAAKDNVTLNVIGAYLQALYASEMVRVANINLAISTDELARRRQMLDAGKIPELDIYEAESQVAQDEVSVVNAENDSILALVDLSQLLNLPSSEDFTVQPLADSRLPLLDPEEVFANAMQNNHGIRAGRIEKEAADKYIDVARSGYIPTLSFSAGVGTNYYKTSGFDNEKFSEQMRHNFSKSIGFSLSVPIFDAFGTRNNIRRAKAQAAVTALQFDDARNTLYKAITQAYTQAVGAEKKHSTATRATASAQAAFEAMQVKYNNGRANATEFSKAKSDYTSALANEVPAKYEALLRARILDFYNRQ